MTGHTDLFSKDGLNDNEDFIYTYLKFDVTFNYKVI